MSHYTKLFLQPYIKKMLPATLHFSYYKYIHRCQPMITADSWSKTTIANSQHDYDYMDLYLYMFNVYTKRKYLAIHLQLYILSCKCKHYNNTVIIVYSQNFNIFVLLL